MVADEDLIAGHKSGQVAAACLDTYEEEPTLNPVYLSLKNTFLLPHLARCSHYRDANGHGHAGAGQY